jgi:hypothetical protein
VTDDEQEARSLKWEGTGSVTIRRLRSGRWAMYHIGGVGSPFWIGPAEDLFRAYDERPPDPVVVRPPSVSARRGPSVDLSKLEFKL